MRGAGRLAILLTSLAVVAASSASPAGAAAAGHEAAGHSAAGHSAAGHSSAGHAALRMPSVPASLYRGPGPAPGPAILYAPLATAPQLTNAGIWHAPPILVSGATAYRDGEFLYQDFIYDDHGAAEAPDPTDPRASGDTFSRPDGTYTYPTGPGYDNNAADLLEFRVKPLPSATAFRVTMNTMVDPTLIAFSVAIGGVPGTTYPFPDGANVSAPAALFLTVHAAGNRMVGQLVHAGTDTPVAGPPPSVAVDLHRHQIQVLVPHRSWNPGHSVVRFAMGVGLWDKTTGSYLLPQAVASASAPGGSGGVPNPPAFFNVAFRMNDQEPMSDPSDVANTATRPSWWRDREQAAALASGDISEFHVYVDFAKLWSRVTDNSNVPRSGAFDRILASHFQTAAGADWSVSCFPAATDGGAGCPGQIQGNLQPYAIYVPPGPVPRGGYGMTLLLHSLSANYNQYLGTRNQWQYADRGPGSIVVTPEGRGPDGFYDSLAGVDTFEVWADVAHRYPLNPAWSDISGYSMGGMGTFKLAEQFPDLFAKAQSTVGYSADPLEASLRNVPVQMWNMAVDELVPAASYYPTARALDSDGYRYELDVFAPGEHLTLAINDEFARAAAFLGTATVDRNPAHVTYVVDPALDYPSYGFVADHAYWLSALRVGSAAATGTIDAVSEGFGTGDPTPGATVYGSGVMTGGTLPAMAYASQQKAWGPVPRTRRADVLRITSTNVASLTVAVARAGLDCRVHLQVSTDVPLTVTLAGCDRTVHFPAAPTAATPPLSVP
jgi:hypothetical protein